jgi:molecular chaperone GrpE
VKQLLPMLDDLERAAEAAAQQPVRNDDPADGVREGREARATGDLVADGIRLVQRSLADMLSREGLVEIDTVGAFDPHTQEALLSQPSDEPEGTVIQVLQKGYRLGDHVLRPARVVVSAGLPEVGPPAHRESTD